MATEVVVRKWGHSIGVVFPKEFAVKLKLKPQERVVLEVLRKANLKKAFGSVPRKMSGQAFKDLAREGWQ